MRRRSIVLLVTLLLAAALGGGRLGSSTTRPQGPGGGGGARGGSLVQRVVDGDTVVLAGLGKARLIGVDTPEVFGGSECFGRQASAYAKRLLPPGTPVRYRLGVDPRDRYDRALVHLFLRDGRHVNELLVRDGYAVPLTIPPNIEYAARFRQLARGARAGGRGLWSACPVG